MRRQRVNSLAVLMIVVVGTILGGKVAVVDEVVHEVSRRGDGIFVYFWAGTRQYGYVL
jgi:hypothetical protein